MDGGSCAYNKTLCSLGEVTPTTNPQHRYYAMIIIVAIITLLMPDNVFRCMIYLPKSASISCLTASVANKKKKQEVEENWSEIWQDPVHSSALRADHIRVMVLLNLYVSLANFFQLDVEIGYKIVPLYQYHFFFVSFNKFLNARKHPDKVLAATAMMKTYKKKVGIGMIEM
uniref:Uncharacterized protein n=1 Tax=Glossina palpalis gambiensis TaxID=67801 RepID=A0A1B0BH83_9MUSC